MGGSFKGGRQGLVAVKNASGGLGSRVASGEEKAEDMAEFFGRDYAGDDEVEQFGGGMLGPRKSGGQATGGGSGDTDGDGDDDSIGTGVFRLGADGEPAATPDSIQAFSESGETPAASAADPGTPAASTTDAGTDHDGDDRG